MRVLLLGGTGAIGENLVKILNNRGVNTVVTSRLERSNFDHITYIKGNAHNVDFLKEICSKHWDAVVDFMSYKTEEFKSRIDILLSSTTQYVFISSARVYAESPIPITENSPRLLDVCTDKEYLATDEYALTKARQEDIIKDHGTNRNYTIIRPYITYSQNRLQLGVLEKEEWLYRALNGHTIVFAEEMCKRVTTMTSGNDVALSIGNMLGNRESLGKIVHVTSGYSRTWDEIFQIYADTFKEVTGKDLKIKKVPLHDFLKCRSEDLEWQVTYDRLYDRSFETAKQSICAGSIPYVSPEVGLRQCLTLFLQSPTFRSISVKYEAHKDRLTGDFANINLLHSVNMKIEYLLNRFIL